MDITYYKKYEPIFGEWKIVREIGEGSFGKVFEIEREDFGYTYKAALKAVTIPQSQAEVETIMDDGMDSESVTTYFRGFVEELIEEFRLMSKLKGESNIVSYEDHRVIPHTDSIGWDILIRMELLTPLLKYTKANALGQAEVINLGIDICKALELCRKHNIIHRDIKPENIFVSENGKFKLGDFGIAKTVEKTTGGLSKKGTYTYMAPEVYKGEEYGASVDIYSLGIVLYRYLNNNRAPFLPEYPALITHTDRTLAIDRRIKGETIPAPANADEALAKVVLKACAYNAKDRYASPTEMREDLEAVAAGVAPAHLAALGTALLPDEEETVRDNPSRADISKEETVKDEGAELEKTTGVFGAFAGAAHKNAAEKRAVETLESEVPKKEPELVSKEAKTKKKSKKEPEAKEKDESKRKTPFIIAASLLLAIVVGIIAFGGGGGKPELQIDWTEWAEELPRGVTDKDYLIEEVTKYRSRDKETKTSTKSDKMDGWKLEKTVDEGKPGAWSDWSTTSVSKSDTREVETETRYRSKNLETTTSSSSSKSGWDLVDTTRNWSDYGSWSDWSTSSVSSSDSRKVDTKTQYRYRTVSYSTQYTSWGSWSSWQDKSVSETSTRDVESATFYRYYYFYCPVCGGHEPFRDAQSDCKKYYITSNDWNCAWFRTPYYQSNYRSFSYTSAKYYTESLGDGQRWCFSSGNVNQTAPGTRDAGGGDVVIKTRYRYRTRSIENVKSYGSWSSWGDTAYSSSSSRDVQTRTLYRYCDRESIPTYHFERWSDWSNWTTQHISSTDTRKVESETFYRYRDKAKEKTYIFSRWTDWSEWSEDPVYETDDNQVETITYYRYKSK